MTNFQIKTNFNLKSWTANGQPIFSLSKGYNAFEDEPETIVSFRKEFIAAVNTYNNNRIVSDEQFAGNEIFQSTFHSLLFL